VKRVYRRLGFFACRGRSLRSCWGRRRRGVRVFVCTCLPNCRGGRSDALIRACLRGLMIYQVIMGLLTVFVDTLLFALRASYLCFLPFAGAKGRSIAELGAASTWHRRSAQCWCEQRSARDRGQEVLHCCNHYYVPRGTDPFVALLE